MTTSKRVIGRMKTGNPPPNFHDNESKIANNDHSSLAKYHCSIYALNSASLVSDLRDLFRPL